MKYRMLPKLRQTVTIKFSSLRDRIVIRKAYRVNAEHGWKWQIKSLDKLRYDPSAETDQKVLDEIGSGDGVEFGDGNEFQQDTK
jgi:hypothetical protein